MDLQIGQAVDRYVVESILGEGACGVVYRVRHARLGSQHALKVLQHTPRSLRIRLAQEGQIQAGLRHPNIVPVTDIVDIQDTPGLIAEFIDGPDLDEWRRLSRPDPAAAEAIFRQLLAGLAFAHSKGIIHRDLKPGNILVARVDEQDVPRITDFGIAKVLTSDSPELTRSQTSMGSPRYMAPEQWRSSRDVDQRADIFSMGCILYELLCGQPAFPADNLPDIFQAAAAERYTDPAQHLPDIPSALRETIIGCLRPDPGDRFADCAAVIAALSMPPAVETPLQIIEDAPPQPTLTPDTASAAAETLAPLAEELPEEAPAAVPQASTQELLAATRPSRMPWLVGGAVVLVALALLAPRLFSTPEPAGEPVEEPVTEAEEPAEDPVEEPADDPPPEAVVDAAPEEDTPPDEEPADASPPEVRQPIARIRATGTVDAVWLEQGGKRFAMGEVPAGRYQIKATFAGSTVPAGDISLRPGERVTVKCDDLFQQCRREEL